MFKRINPYKRKKGWYFNTEEGILLRNVTLVNYHELITKYIYGRGE